MWGIENPWTVFRYVYQRDPRRELNFMCLINETKWNQLPDVNRIVRLVQKNQNLRISSVKIKDPDNPARLNPAKLIQYSI